ncbi:MAG: hypothetical protein PHC53_05660, partial [Patescibacteria group bacterium]|nr:hypothetical protein [Patescibacteria group bacterium]
MTDSSIHDATLVGSPIMSYGEAPINRRITKLLVVLAGSFVVVLLALGVWFWAFSSIPLPADISVMAVVPAHIQLPSQAPDVWKQAAEINSPLPTVMGFVTDKQSGKPTPFAIQVFSFSDLMQGGKLATWKIISEKDIQPLTNKSPLQLFGFPSFNKSVWLSIKPKELLGLQAGSADLPDEMNGPLENGVWKISGSTVSINQAPSTTDSFVPLSPFSSSILANFSQANGLAMHLPDSGWVNWSFQADTINFVIQPETPIDPKTVLDLATSHDLFDKRGALLEDQTAIQILMPPTSLPTATDWLPNGKFAMSFDKA